MPVIVLGGRSSLPIDPTFEDGGNIQTIGTSWEDFDAFSTNDPFGVIGTDVITGSGGASFNGSITSTIPGDVVIVVGGFTIDVLPIIGTIPTPNIVPPPAAPGVSPVGGMPTVGDFDDDSVIQNMGTSVVTIADGFFQPSTVTTVDPTVSSVQAGSNSFTSGTVTSGTTPATEIDATVGTGFGLISPVTDHVVGTQVVS